MTQGFAESDEERLQAFLAAALTPEGSDSSDQGAMDDVEGATAPAGHVTHPSSSWGGSLALRLNLRGAQLKDEEEQYDETLRVLDRQDDLGDRPGNEPGPSGRPHPDTPEWTRYYPYQSSDPAYARPPLKMRKKLCYLLPHGKCFRAERCTFAHSLAEPFPRADGSIDLDNVTDQSVVLDWYLDLQDLQKELDRRPALEPQISSDAGFSDATREPRTRTRSLADRLSSDAAHDFSASAHDKPRARAPPMHREALLHRVLSSFPPNFRLNDASWDAFGIRLEHALRRIPYGWDYFQREARTRNTYDRRLDSELVQAFAKLLGEGLEATCRDLSRNTKLATSRSLWKRVDSNLSGLSSTPKGFLTDEIGNAAQEQHQTEVPGLPGHRLETELAQARRMLPEQFVFSIDSWTDDAFILEKALQLACPAGLKSLRSKEGDRDTALRMQSFLLSLCADGTAAALGGGGPALWQRLKEAMAPFSKKALDVQRLSRLRERESPLRRRQALLEQFAGEADIAM